MAVSVVSFSFFMAAQPDPGVNSSVCWLSLLHRVYLRLPLYCLPSFSPISSIRRPYITFKLPRSNIDTPQRLRNLFRFPATGMCHFLPVHHLEWHFWPGQNITQPLRVKMVMGVLAMKGYNPQISKTGALPVDTV